MSQIQLIGSDEQQVLVDRAAAEAASLVLRDLLNDQPVEDGEPIDIPVPVVPGNVLAAVAEYMRIHVKSPAKELERPLRSNLFDVLDEVDKNLIAEWDEAFTMEVVVASNFLNIPPLKDLASARLAQWIKEKSVEEIRIMFGLENDFTPEEEAILKKEHGLV